MARPRKKQETSKKPLPIFNIALFIVLLGTVSWWFLRFIGVWASLAPLAGLLSGLLVKIIPERTLKAIPEVVRGMLLAPRFRTACLGTFAMWFLVACFVGAVNVHSEDERTISIGREGSVSLHAVAKQGEVQTPFLTAPFFPATIWVDDQRLPALSHRLSPWHVDDIWCPRELLRPVLLLRPSRDLIASLLNEPLTVEVRRKNTVIAGAKLDGYHSALVGAKHVVLPSELEKAWTDELGKEDALGLLQSWKDYIPASPNVTLSPGEQLEIEVKFMNGVTRDRLPVTCGRPERPGDIPQVVDLT